MKKLIYGTLFLALVGIGVVGCKKELPKNSLKEQINSKTSSLNFPYISIVDNDYLKFETVDDYIRFVEDTSQTRDEIFIEEINSLNFNHYFTANGGLEFRDTIDDGIELEMDYTFGHVLNTVGIIQIGDYICRVSLEDESVYVIADSKKQTAYTDLRNGNTQNNDVHRYSIDDDVIEVLLNQEIPKCGGVGGGTYRCYANSYEGQIIKEFENGVVWRLNPFVHFFRAGIFFRLSSQYEVYRYLTEESTSNGQIVDNINGQGITIEMFVKGPVGWWKRRPCNNGTIGIQTAGYHYCSSKYGKEKRTLYSGSRNLNGYHLFVQGRAKYDNGTYTIASPYGGRNVNSPY